LASRTPSFQPLCALFGSCWLGSVEDTGCEERCRESLLGGWSGLGELLFLELVQALHDFVNSLDPADRPENFDLETDRRLAAAASPLDESENSPARAGLVLLVPRT